MSRDRDAKPRTSKAATARTEAEPAAPVPGVGPRGVAQIRALQAKGNAHTARKLAGSKGSRGPRKGRAGVPGPLLLKSEEDDLPGANPASLVDLKSGGVRIVIDGDGDQRKELEIRLRMRRDAATPGTDAPTPLAVELRHRASGAKGNATFDVPAGRIDGWLHAVVTDVTDGVAPTLIEIQGAGTLQILPARSDPSGTTYGMSLLGKQANVTLPRGRARHERKDKIASTGTFSDQIGGVTVLDVTLGAYKDPFRLTFRKNSDSAGTLGISALYPGGVPTGTGGTALTFSGALRPQILETDGTNIAVDLNGDGTPDVQIFDQLMTPREYDGGGRPARNRNHAVRVRGPAVGEHVFRFQYRESMIRGGFANPREQDREAMRDGAAAIQLGGQLHDQEGKPRGPEAFRAAATLSALDGAILGEYQVAAAKGTIPEDVATAFACLRASLIPIRATMDKPGAIDPNHVAAAAQCADDYRAAYLRAVAGPTRSGVPGTARNMPNRIGPAAALKSALMNDNRDAAFRWFDRIVEEMDRLVASRTEKGSADTLKANQETRRRYRQELGGMPSDAIRIPMLFHPSDEYKHDQAYRATIAYEMYAWNDPEAKQWVLRDVTNKADMRPFKAPAAPNEKSPPAKLFEELDHVDYFPNGAMTYQVPGGVGGRVNFTGNGIQYRKWLSYASTGLLVAGTIAAVAGGPIGVTAFLLAAGNVAGLGRGAIDMYERGRHDHLDTTTAVLDIAAVLGSAAHLTALGGKLVVNQAVRAGEKGAPMSGSLAKLANFADSAWVPLKATETAMDGVQLLVFAPLMLSRMEKLAGSNLSPEDQAKANAELAGILSVATICMITLYAMKGGAGLKQLLNEKRLEVRVGPDGRPIVVPAGAPARPTAANDPDFDPPPSGGAPGGSPPGGGGPAAGGTGSGRVDAMGSAPRTAANDSYKDPNIIELAKHRPKPPGPSTDPLPQQVPAQKVAGSDIVEGAATGSSRATKTSNGRASAAPLDPKPKRDHRPSGRNEQHGDGGTELARADRRIVELEAELAHLFRKQGPKKEKDRLIKLIKNLKERAYKNRRGVNHSTKDKS